MKTIKKFMGIAITVVILISTIAAVATFSSSADSVVYKWPKTDVKGDTWKTEGMYGGSWGAGLTPIFSADDDGNASLSFKPKQLTGDYAKAAQLNLDFRTGDFAPEEGKTYYVEITNHTSEGWKVMTNWSGDSNTQMLPPNQTTEIELITADNTTLAEIVKSYKKINFTIQTTTWPNGGLAADFMTISPIYVEGDAPTHAETTTAAPVQTTAAQTTTTAAKTTTSSATTPSPTLPEGTLVVHKWPDVNIKGDIWKTEGMYGGNWGAGLTPLLSVDNEGNADIKFNQSQFTGDYAKAAQANLDFRTGDFVPEDGKTYYVEITNHTSKAWKVMTNWAGDSNTQILPANQTTEIELITADDTTLAEVVKSYGKINFTVQTTTWPSGELAADFITISPIYVDGAAVTTTAKATTAPTTASPTTAAPTVATTAPIATTAPTTTVTPTADEYVKYVSLSDGTLSVEAGKDISSTKSIVIPSSVNGKTVTKISKGCFANCDWLESITLPESITNIGDYAFSNCTSLKSISIPDSVTNIGNYAFNNCSLIKGAVISKNVKNIGYGAFDLCESLKSIYVATENEAYSSYDGILFNKDKSKIIRYPIAKTDENYIVPVSVTNISACAFKGCASIKDITISESVTTIGESAFAGCASLAHVNIPSGVKLIDDYVFAYCTSLTDISIPGGVVKIGDSAFWTCTSLTNVKLPNGVISLNDFAFGDCTSLESIVIPDSVIIFGDDLFQNDNKLVIKCYSQSKAEQYAVEQGIDYEYINEEHVYIHHDAVEAQCEKTGIKEYYSCENCRKIFDKDMNETTLDKLIIPAKGHSYVHIDEDHGTYKKDGVKEHYLCKDCGKVFDKNKKLISMLELLIPKNVFGIDISSGKDVLPSDVDFIVDKIVDGEKHDAIENTLKTDKINVYDITAIYNGEPVQPKGIVKLTFEVPDDFDSESVTVYYISEDGKTEQIKCSVDKENSKVTAEIQHFSTFVVAEKSDMTDIQFGDANGDGKVTAADVLLMRKSIAGQSVTLSQTAADVNCDGKLTASDVLLVRKHIAGQNVQLGK